MSLAFVTGRLSRNFAKKTLNLKCLYSNYILRNTFGSLAQDNQYRFTKDHEWMTQPDESQLSYVGISNYAQEQLGDVTVCELPEVGETFDENDEFGGVDSVKMSSALYCPVECEIAEVNEKVQDDPSLINEDCEGDGWMIRIKVNNPQDFNKLMSREDYDKFVEES